MSVAALHGARNRADPWMKAADEIDPPDIPLPHPVDFARSHGIDLWPGQVEFLESVHENTYTVVYSGADLSKTFTMGAILIPWWLQRPDSLVVVTSGTYQQLRAQLWWECRVNAHRYGFEAPPDKAAWELPGNRSVELRSTKKQEYFTGFHRQHVLVVGDEGHGLPRWIFNTVETAIGTNPDHRVAIVGNPVEDIGPYIALKRDPDWNAVHLSQIDYVEYAREHGPIEGMDLDLDAPQKVIDKMGADSPWVQTYVFGRPPDPGAGAVVLFPPWKVEDAFGRSVDPARSEPLEVGFDVARTGGDRSVAYARWGYKVWPLLDLGPEDAASIRPGDRDRYLSWLIQRLDDELKGLPREPDVVRVDADGLGEGPADELISLGYNVARVHLGSVPPTGDAGETYYDLRSYGFWHLGDILSELDLPRDTELIEELHATKPTYKKANVTKKRTRRPKMQGKTVNFRLVSPKDEIIDAIGHSPDRADALMLAFLPVKPGRKKGEKSKLEIDPKVAERWGRHSLLGGGR